jgi:hypothetical protein
MNTYYKKSYHVGAYTYKAGIWCCDCVANDSESFLSDQGFTKKEIQRFVDIWTAGSSYGITAFRSEALLHKVAEIKNIDISDPYSFDSDDFPKIIFNDEMEDEEYCENCLKEIE